MKLILMDFDDTITDSIEADYYSFIKASQIIVHKSNRTVSLNKFKKLRKNGEIAAQITSEILGATDKNTITKFNNIRHKLLLSSEVLDKIRLNRGTRELLDYLKNKGYLIAITTYKSDKMVIDKMLSNFGISDYFDKIFCGNGSKSIIESKRDLYSKAVEHYKVKKKDVVVIGNLPEDLIPSKELGLKCIGVASNYSNKSDLVEYGEVVSDISALREIL